MGQQEEKRTIQDTSKIRAKKLQAERWNSYLNSRTEKQTEEQTEHKKSVFENGLLSGLKDMTKATSDVASGILGIGSETATSSASDGSETEEKPTWFRKQSISSIGDFFKVAAATGSDLSESFRSGMVGFVEPTIDTLIQLGLGVDPSLDYMAKQIVKDDLIDERAVGRVWNEINGGNLWNRILNGKTEDLSETEGLSETEDLSEPRSLSVLGKKSESLAESLGLQASASVLQAFGIPWWVTMGVSSYGGQVEQAYTEGASFGEATLSGLISAGAEVVSEKMFGGDFLTSKGAEGFLSNLLTKGISSKALRSLAKFGLDLTGEGSEEVFSSFMGRLGTSLYKEENLGEILFSEEAMEEYLDSFIGGAAMGGFFSGTNVAKSIRTGRDTTSGMTSNEEKVLRSEYNRLLEEAGQKGDVSAKQKSELWQSAKDHLVGGDLSTATIEKVLEGKPTVKDSYLWESYQNEQARKQGFEADLSQYSVKERATVQKAVESGFLNNTKKSHQFVDFMAKISARTGLEIDFTNNKALRESGLAIDGQTVNGIYRDGRITVNTESRKALDSVVGHEITHALEHTELYAPLQKAVFDYAKKKGVYDKRLGEIEDLYRSDPNAVIENELAAELIGDYVFSDEAFVERLARTDRNLFEKIYDEIKSLCRMATAGSKEARELEKVKRTFEKALDELDKTQKNTKSTSAEQIRSNSLSRSDGADGVENGIAIAPMTENSTSSSDDIGPVRSLADTLEGRSEKSVGSRSVHAAMYDNPVLKPFYQAEAEVMLDELNQTQKGNGARRIERVTTSEIAHLKDQYGYSYGEIEEGIRAIIQDEGRENCAVSKRIELMIHDRLTNGYTSYGNRTEPNADYLALMNEEYTPEGEARIVDAKPKEKKKNRILMDARRTVVSKGSVFEDLGFKEKNRAIMDKFQAIGRSKAKAQYFLGHGAEDVPALTEVYAKAEELGITSELEEYVTNLLNVDRMTLEERGKKKAEKILADDPILSGIHGEINAAKVRDAIAEQNPEMDKKTVRKQAGKVMKTYRQAEALQRSVNKPVYGASRTAEISQKLADKIEKAHPEVKELAEQIWAINTYLRKLMVDGGLISPELSATLEEMYPHYIPIQREGKSGLGVSVPLDSTKTNVNNPLRRATGGSGAIVDLFDTMANRAEQVFYAIARNQFGIELKNTLNTVIQTGDSVRDLDDADQRIDDPSLNLKEGKGGSPYSFTVFENGRAVTFAIDDQMYKAMKPTEENLKGNRNKKKQILDFTGRMSSVHKKLITEYNPMFTLTNFIKDTFDTFVNSKHPAATLKEYPSAVRGIRRNSESFQQYLSEGALSASYYDTVEKKFTEKQKKEVRTLRKVIGAPLHAVSYANELVEQVPRFAEYLASIKKGATVEAAMRDAAEVTTNFGDGGDFGKALNRWGATFLNASIQGAAQQVRNVREAWMRGPRGILSLVARYTLMGLPVILLNALIWDDDEEYEELPDYVKQNYFIVAKYGDGKFVRIPKGRAMAVIQDAFRQTVNAINPDEEADWGSFFQLVVNNLAPNNPISDNIFAPVVDAAKNKAWHGGDIVPERLQNLPKGEQADETTDAISRWIGEKINVSPYKLNYLLDQYSGVIGDFLLPLFTPESTSDVGFLAPVVDKFTTDSVINNRYPSDFYEKVDELSGLAQSVNATAEDTVKSKYMNSVNSAMSELSRKKREIQNSDLSKDEKYMVSREIQRQIDEMAKDALDTYEDVRMYQNYAAVGNTVYKKNSYGEWVKMSDADVQKSKALLQLLEIDPGETRTYDFPTKYFTGEAVGGYHEYIGYHDEITKIEKEGSVSDVVAYINSLEDLDRGEKMILYKSRYEESEKYNSAIVSYLRERDDLSYEEKVKILEELGAKITEDHTVKW